MARSLSEWCAEQGDEALLRQWDADQNAPLRPETVSSSCKRKVYWKCEKGHQWAAAVYARTGGSGCPYCAGLKPVPGETDLATTHPALAAQWDFPKNGNLTPRDVSAGSHRLVFWRCAKGHVWSAPIHRRAYNHTDCPYCAGTLPIPGETDFATRCPELAAEWDAEKNGDLKPSQVLPNSRHLVWWRCAKGHSYQSAVRSRGGGGTGCPYCAGKAVLAGFNDLATKQPELAKQWYQPLNGSLTPERVTIGCNRKVAWRCAEGHVWFAAVNSRSGPNGNGCPVCAGQVKKARLAFYDKVAQTAPRRVSFPLLADSADSFEVTQNHL